MIPSSGQFCLNMWYIMVISRKWGPPKSLISNIVVIISPSFLLWYMIFLRMLAKSIKLLIQNKLQNMVSVVGFKWYYYQYTCNRAKLGVLSRYMVFFKACLSCLMYRESADIWISDWIDCTQNTNLNNPSFQWSFLNIHDPTKNERWHHRFMLDKPHHIFY